MGRLSESENRAQIERIIAYNFDETWDEKKKKRFRRELDVVKGLAFRSRLPHRIQQDRYGKMVEQIITAYAGQVRFDPQTLKEMEDLGEEIHPSQEPLTPTKKKEQAEKKKTDDTSIGKRFKGAILSIFEKLKSFRDRIFGKTKMLGEGKSEDSLNSQISSAQSEREEFIDGLRVEQSRNLSSQERRSDKPKKREKKPEKDRDE